MKKQVKNRSKYCRASFRGRFGFNFTIMSLVYFKNVSKSYDGFLVLDNITFTMEAGEFVSLVGRSGVGKTTLLKMLIREELPTRVRFILMRKILPN